MILNIPYILFDQSNKETSFQVWNVSFIVFLPDSALVNYVFDVLSLKLWQVIYFSRPRFFSRELRMFNLPRNQKCLTLRYKTPRSNQLSWLWWAIKIHHSHVTEYLHFSTFATKAIKESDFMQDNNKLFLLLVKV